MSPSNESSWRNKNRALRGRRKGQFTKKKVVLKMEAAQTTLLNMRLGKIQNNNSLKDEWFENCDRILNGRRIVELVRLAKELWCDNCNLPLSLRHASDETRFGLSSLITVKCKICNATLTIHTDKIMPINEYNFYNHTYVVNLKAAMGMIDAGIGEAHLNTFLSALNIPIMSAQLLKRHERMIGKATENVAENSCKDAIHLEKELTLQKEIIVDNSRDSPSEVIISNNKIGLKFSFDCAWQKRGTGRSYNSLSGQAMLIGYYSGKVTSYTVRSKICRLCQVGRSKEKHDCRANFNGSAKSMEPDMAIELFTKNKLLEEANVYASVIIGDDDSSTIATVRRNATHDVVKLSDYNHTYKAFTSGLWEMKLTDQLREYFSRSFSIAIKTHRNDANAVRTALQSIVPHAFCDHEQCGEWCNGRILKENYIHSNLPGGKSLEDTRMRQKLTHLFSRFIKAADKIAPCASTQANESMNNVVCSKSPKSRHYSASESLNYRVAASVCQKNIGCKYITSVFERLDVSPGRHTEAFRLKKDQRRELKRKMSQTKEIKRKRLFRKRIQSAISARKQRVEGVTYETAIPLNNISGTLQNNNLQENNNNNKLKNLTNYALVFFDLETTGLKSDDQICQIAAYDGELSYNKYIIPSKSISKSASEKTNMRIIDGEMFVNDTRVSTISSKSAVEQFLEFLEEVKLKNHKENDACSVILVAHNGFIFDVPRILSLIFQVGLQDSFQSAVFGFADSLTILKNHLLERKSNKLSFSIENLVKDFLPDENLDGLHNALDDVVLLKKIIDHCHLPYSVIQESSRSVHQFIIDQNNKGIIALNKDSLKIYEGKIAKSCIKKLAEAGINKNILDAAFLNNGHSGLRFLLQESINGKARVKLSKKALEKVLALFSL